MIRELLKNAERGGKKQIRWLQKRGLLAKKMKCPKCRLKMNMCRTTSSKDGYRWICRKSKHSTSCSIRKGSIFYKSHLSLSSWLKIMHNLCQGLRRRHIDMLEDGVCGSCTSITKVTTLLRKVCVSALRSLEKQGQMRIGGARAFVVIDESKFRHRRKYQRGRFGRTWNRKSWVLGMLEVKDQQRLPVLRLVKKRSRRHMIPIIKKYVKAQSQIITDSWRVYDSLSEEGYIHYQVNHRRYFVHPQTGAHTQHIERSWRSHKENIYRWRGNLTEKTLKMNLRFIEWNQWLGKKHRAGIAGRLLKDIRAYYRQKYSRYT